MTSGLQSVNANIVGITLWSKSQNTLALWRLEGVYKSRAFPLSTLTSK